MIPIKFPSITRNFTVALTSERLYIRRSDEERLRHVNGF